MGRSGARQGNPLLVCMEVEQLYCSSIKAILLCPAGWTLPRSSSSPLTCYLPSPALTQHVVLGPRADRGPCLHCLSCAAAGWALHVQPQRLCTGCPCPWRHIAFCSAADTPAHVHRHTCVVHADEHLEERGFREPGMCVVPVYSNGPRVWVAPVYSKPSVLCLSLSRALPCFYSFVHAAVHRIHIPTGHRKSLYQVTSSPTVGTGTCT